MTAPNSEPPAVGFALLLVEDSALDAELILDALRAGGLVPNTQRVEDEAGLRAALTSMQPDVILADWTLPGFSGAHALQIVRAHDPEIPFIFVSGTLSDTVALTALRQGATDYLFKDQLDLLVGILNRALAERRLAELRRVAEAESRLAATVFRASGEGLFITDAVERIIDANPAFTRITGYARDEVVGRTPRILSSGLQSDSFYAAMWDAIKAEGCWQGELHNRHKTGRIYAEWLTVSRVDDSNGIARYYIGSCNDITERKQAEAGLQLAAKVFSHARESIMITDAAGTIVDVNDAFTRTTGCLRADVLGQNPRILKSGRHGPDFYAKLWREVLSQGFWTGEIWNRCKDGTEYAAILTLSAVKDQQSRVQNYVALYSDITEMKEYQKQLEYIAHYDALTGLPNRILLADRLKQAMAHVRRRGRSLAVLFLDLDGFKPVNDQHGHNVGDQVLVVVAQRMREALRDGDTIARVGGDEFVAVLTDLDAPPDQNPILQRLLQTVAEPIELGHLTLQVSTSIGVAMFPEDGQDADKLLRYADQAMYQAKQQGRNRFHRFVRQTNTTTR